METLQAYIERAREMWESLDRNRKIAIGGGAGAVLLVLMFLTFSGGEADVRLLPLYTDLDLKEAGQLTARLQDIGQDFELGGDGSIILVPEEDRLRLRTSLAAEGYPKTGLIGYEVFDEVPLGMTDFLQKVKLRQALEGELRKTILQLDQVEDVRLHVVMPEPSLFVEEEQPPTASIMLRLRPRMTLSPEQIKGVQNLVASSVEGLHFRNITVVDNEGTLLSEDVDPVAGATTKQLEIQRNVEHYLEARAQDVLDKVRGRDQAVVRIAVDLSFDQTEETIESFDSENPVLLSEDRSEESSAEAGTKERVTSNYEISKTIRRITGAVGSIRRVSASLTVNSQKPIFDRDSETLSYEVRTPEEFDQVAGVVRGAIGYDDTRGDQLKGALQTTVNARPQEAVPVLPGELATLSQQMEEAGLERGLAEEVLTSILLDPGEVGLKALKPLQDRTVGLLARRFRPPCPTRLAEGLRTVVALVGPAGCGKTTAAARLAAHFASEHGARPAFVAADTDRVGGLEQLRAYAGILEFPVDVVRAPEKMGDVIRSRRDVDLILIDSAGASPLDSDQIDGLAALLKEAGPSDIHLTLDASHGIRQMLDAVDAFSRAGADRILLTKLDETARLGAACCLAVESRLPLSYTTDGRAVPGHLHAADPEGLVRALFDRRPHGPAG